MSTTNHTMLVDKALGSAFDIVYFVVEHFEEIKSFKELYDFSKEVATNIPIIEQVNNYIPSFTTFLAEYQSIDGIINSISTINQQINTANTNISSINTTLQGFNTSLQSVITNINNNMNKTDINLIQIYEAAQNA